MLDSDFFPHLHADRHIQMNKQTNEYNFYVFKAKNKHTKYSEDFPLRKNRFVSNVVSKCIFVKKIAKVPNLCSYLFSLDIFLYDTELILFNT